MKVQILPRKTGVVVLQTKGITNFALTDLIRKNRKADSEIFDQALGLRPYAGMKITTERESDDKLVVAKFEIYKDGQLVWSVYDPQELKRGMVFYPAFAFNFHAVEKCEGKWQMRVKLTILSKKLFHNDPKAVDLENYSFTVVDGFDWEVIGLQLQLKPTGERIHPPKKVDPNIVVNINDI